MNIITESSRYVKFLPVGRFVWWKGSTFTQLEGPGTYNIPRQFIATNNPPLVTLGDFRLGILSKMAETFRCHRMRQQEVNRSEQLLFKEREVVNLRVEVSRLARGQWMWATPERDRAALHVVVGVWVSSPQRSTLWLYACFAVRNPS